MSLTHSQGGGSGQRRRESSPATEAAVRSQHVVELGNVEDAIAVVEVMDVESAIAVVEEIDVEDAPSPREEIGQPFRLFLLRLC